MRGPRSHWNQLCRAHPPELCAQAAPQAIFSPTEVEVPDALLRTLIARYPAFPIPPEPRLGLGDMVWAMANPIRLGLYRLTRSPRWDGTSCACVGRRARLNRYWIPLPRCLHRLF